MNIKERINEILNSKEEGFFNLSLADYSNDIEDLSRLDNYSLQNNYIIRINFNIIDNAIFIEKISALEFLKEVDNKFSNIENLNSLDEIISESILEKYNLSIHLNLLKERIIKWITSNRFNGYSYKINEDGAFSREKGYDFLVKFTNKHNKPYVTITNASDKTINRVPIYKGRCDIRFTEKEVNLPFSKLDRLMDVNNLTSKNMYVDSESIPYFYGFEKGDSYEFSVKLTKSFVDKWWNYDCPRLAKFYPNIDDSTNWVGYRPVNFENTLVDWSYSGTSVDEDITLEEVNTLTNGREDTSISHDIILTYKASNTKKEDASLIEKEIVDYETNINEAIEKFKLDILTETCIEFLGKEKFEEEYSDLTIENPHYSRLDKTITILNNNEPNGFDCGFLYFYPSSSDKHMSDLYVMAKTLLKERTLGNIDINSIWNGQSVTIKRIIGAHTVKKIKDVLDIDIIYNTVLD